MTARTAPLFAILVCGLAAGCSNTGSLSTAAITPDKPIAAAKVDPACSTLASQIDALRQDGAADRLEKAAAGKATKVSVKRDTLTKQVELNKANAEFQAKCAPAIPRAQTAQAATPATPTAGQATAQVAPVAAQAATAAAKAQ